MKNLILLLLVLIVSCKENFVPKPKAQLRLSYPEANYKQQEVANVLLIDINTFSDTLRVKKLASDKNSYAINIEYPKLKGTIYLTYKPVINDSILNKYLIDAQAFTQEHTVKADEIIEQPYANENRKVYGMFYEVGGNAASQAQFYVTDSTKHFLTGSLYFYTKPNYDSILPAAHYLQKDVRQIMESVTWKNNK